MDGRMGFGRGEREMGELATSVRDELGRTVASLLGERM